jgi:hypothetical protein
MKKIPRILITPSVFFSVICAIPLNSSAAPADNKIKLLIIADDSDRRNIERSSDASKSLLSKFKESLKSKGYQVLEEKLLNTELGFIIRNRLSKSDLIAIFQMARRNDKETIAPTQWYYSVCMPECKMANSVKVLSSV